MPYITSTTTEVWPSAIRKSPLVQTSEAQSTVSIIHDVLTDKISARDAAQSISSLYEPELRQDASLSSLWTIIVDAIRNTTGNGVTLQRLARAIAQLSRLPDTIGDNGQALKSKRSVLLRLVIFRMVMFTVYDVVYMEKYGSILQQIPISTVFLSIRKRVC